MTKGVALSERGEIVLTAYIVSLCNGPAQAVEVVEVEAQLNAVHAQEAPEVVEMSRTQQPLYSP
jgi:hypothetical protein